MTTAGRTRAAVAVGVALACLLPFAHGLALGRTFYFRDLALHFIPTRLFALQGVRAGELRYWNPLLHEGVPSAFPPLSYPLELLQLAWPAPRGISLVLALHVALAALALFLLATSRGASLAGAAAGALVYGLGGFALSTLNLYVYAHALAWAPVVVWSLVRAARGGGRDVALAGAVVAVALSTLGVEVVAQAVVGGAVLGFARDRAVIARLSTAAALGAALAAPVLLPLRSVVAASQRGQGFPTAVVLAHSVHPLTWPQVLVANWHGDLGDLANAWWGANFFPRGFPYVLSLYLGAAAVAVAIVGARTAFAGRGRLLALLLVGVVACLGRYAGLEGLVDVLGPLRAFRYPVKAFFTVHLAAALLVAHGATALDRAVEGAWPRLARTSLVAGGLLLALLALPVVAPSAVSGFLAGFTPPDLTWVARDAVLRLVLADAAKGAAAAVVAGLVALAAVRGRIAPARATAAVAVLLAADLLRAGAGLNPMVAPEFLQPGAALAEALPALRAGRVYTCATHESPAYWRARAARPQHELWTFATAIETLTPETNLPLAVPTAYSEDFTSLLSPALTPRPRESCAAFEALAPRLRRAAVTTVLSLDPLGSPDVEARAVWRPERIAPLAVNVYALRDPRPRWAVVEALRDDGAVAGRVVAVDDRGDVATVAVEADAAGWLLVRDGYSPGWRARVDGREAEVLRADEVHRAVPVPAGRHEVALAYHPPGLRAGLVLGAAALAAAVALAVRDPWRAEQNG